MISWTSLFHFTAIDETLEKSGSSELDERLVERLIDGMLYAFQEVGSENDKAILKPFHFGKAFLLKRKEYGLESRGSSASS